MQYESSPAVLSPHFYKTIHTREQPYKSENSPWGEAPDFTGKSI